MGTKLLNLKILYFSVFLILTGLFMSSFTNQSSLPEHSVKVYPTEVRGDHFFIELTDIEMQKVNFKMTNLIGNEVQIELIELSPGKIKVNIPNKLAAGIYLIKINSVQSQIIKKIIVKN